MIITFYFLIMTQKNHKESFYFPHYYWARNDDKILELRARFWAEWYGVFWMILETMAENSDGSINRELIGGLSLGYNLPISHLEEILNFLVKIGIFVEDDGLIFSPKMIEHKNFKKTLQDAGKAGAEKRWKNREAISPPNSKEKKRKENNNISKDILSVVSEKVSEKFSEYLEYRKENKMKSLKETSITSQLKNLSKYSEQEAIDMIEQSIRNGWTGIFELKNRAAASRFTPSNALTWGKKKDYSLPSPSWK